MLNTKKLLFVSYYGLVGLALTIQVMTTVYQASQIVGRGARLAELTQQKNELAVQQESLRTELATKLSLTDLAHDNSIAHFERIAQPIVLTSGSVVASR